MRKIAIISSKPNIALSMPEYGEIQVTEKPVFWHILRRVICEKVAATHQLRISLSEYLLLISPGTIQGCFEISYLTNLEINVWKNNLFCEFFIEI